MFHVREKLIFFLQLCEAFKLDTQQEVMLLERWELETTINLKKVCPEHPNSHERGLKKNHPADGNLGEATTIIWQTKLKVRLLAAVRAFNRPKEASQTLWVTNVQLLSTLNTDRPLTVT